MTSPNQAQGFALSPLSSGRVVELSSEKILGGKLAISTDVLRKNDHVDGCVDKTLTGELGKILSEKVKN